MGEMIVDFNLELLRAFITVARLGTLSAAAKELKTTQPNLGRQMTALSKKVGIELFIRHSRGYILTPQGHEFLALCSAITGELIRGASLIRDNKDTPEGVLKIVTGLGSYEDIVKHIKEFSKLYPKITFDFSSSINVLQLQIGEADVIFSPVLFKDSDLVQKHVYDMVLRIYATPEYLSCHSKPKTMKELQNHQLIVYSDDIQNKWNIHLDQIDTTSIQPYLKVNSGPAMKLALLNHLGIGSYAFDEELIDKGLLIDLFPNMADFRVPYYYSYHRRLENSLKIKVFLDLVNKAIKSRTR